MDNYNFYTGDNSNYNNLNNGSYFPTDTSQEENKISEPQVVEDLDAIVKKTLENLENQSAEFKGEKNIPKDPRFWFTKIYQYVSEEILHLLKEQPFDHPDFVKLCIIYFERIYFDNLRSENPEPHWDKVFNKGLSYKSYIEIEAQYNTPSQFQAPGVYLIYDYFMHIYWNITLSLYAHIRYDLPRAIIWVYNSFYQNSNSLKDFDNDYFNMTEVFNRAINRILDDIYLSSITKGLAEDNVPVQENLFELFEGTNIGVERGSAWRRAELLLKESSNLKGPYKIENTTVEGNVLKKDNFSLLNDLSSAYRPTMDDLVIFKIENIQIPEDVSTFSLSEKIIIISTILLGSVSFEDGEKIIKILSKSDIKDCVSIINSVKAYMLFYKLDHHRKKLLKFMEARYFPFISSYVARNILRVVFKNATSDWEIQIVLSYLSTGTKNSFHYETIMSVGGYKILNQLTNGIFSDLSNSDEYRKTALLYYKQCNYFERVNFTTALSEILLAHDEIYHEEWVQNFIVSFFECRLGIDARDILLKIGNSIQPQLYDDLAEIIQAIQEFNYFDEGETQKTNYKFRFVNMYNQLGIYIQD